MKRRKGWFSKAKRKWFRKRVFSFHLWDDGGSLGNCEYNWKGSDRTRVYLGWNKDEYEQLFRHLLRLGAQEAFFYARHHTFKDGCKKGWRGKGFDSENFSFRYEKKQKFDI